jgi:uncharacterized RDD family membrane protein YckC
MKTKKVTGERLLAAILDYVFLQIIGVIVAVVPLLIIGIDDFVAGAIMGTTTNDVYSQDFITYTMITVYASVIVGVIWLSIIPWKMNGQTIGKKIMKVKVVDEDGVNPGLKVHLIRAIQNWSGYYMALVAWLMYVNVWAYSIASIFNFVISIVFLVSLIMFLAREDSRGLHDMLAGTYVVRVDQNVDELFVTETSQMGDWIEVEDEDDDGFEDKDKDEWSF